MIPVGTSTRGGAGQEDGVYAIQADNGKIHSIDFRPGSRPFEPAFQQGPEQKLGQDISSKELLRRGVNSAGVSDDGGRDEDGEQQRVNPYSYGYSSYDGLGSKMSRHETKHDTGRVTGYYIVEDVDGRKRTVHYVADKDGFRATVHTNEQGTDNQDPASVKMHVENRMPHPQPIPLSPSPEKTSPSPVLGDNVDVPVLDAVDQSVKKS
ncbi:cuticle protein 16.8-like [Dermacentor albipictus]|uniref:cuticle protein 16.8-like n=1 Tax=Dermacentor albipictus TaxID=60249 RepID=UPI0031FD85EB